MAYSDRIVFSRDYTGTRLKDISRLKFAEVDHVMCCSTSSRVQRSSELLSTDSMKDQHLTFTGRMERLADMMRVLGLEPGEIPTYWSKPQGFSTKDRGEGKYMNSPVPQPRVLFKETPRTNTETFGNKDKVNKGKYIHTPVPRPRFQEEQTSGNKPQDFGAKARDKETHQRTPVPKPRVLEKHILRANHKTHVPRSVGNALTDIAIPRETVFSTTEKGLMSSRDSMRSENLSFEIPIPTDMKDELMARKILSGREPPKSAKYCKPVTSKPLSLGLAMRSKSASIEREATRFNNDLEEESTRVCIPVPSCPCAHLRVACWILANDFTHTSNLSPDELDLSCDETDSSRKCRAFLRYTTDDVIFRQAVMDKYRGWEVYTADKLLGALSPETDPSMCGRSTEPGNLETWPGIVTSRKQAASDKGSRPLERLRVFGKKIIQSLTGRCVAAMD